MQLSETNEMLRKLTLISSYSVIISSAGQLINFLLQPQKTKTRGYLNVKEVPNFLLSQQLCL